MTMATAILLSQTCLTGFLAAWLSLGARDNIFHPEMNGTFTAQVLGLERLKEEFPQDYEQVKHRRISNPKIQNALFRLIVIFETLVCVVLWVGTIWLGLSVVSLADAANAKPVALIGALGFTSIWCGFLIGGNHFAYWYCHVDAQNTHYQMALWGIGTMIFLCF